MQGAAGEKESVVRAKIVVRFSAEGIEVHGQLVAVDRTVGVAPLRAGHPHVVKRIRMLRVVRKRLLVQYHPPFQVACHTCGDNRIGDSLCAMPSQFDSLRHGSLLK